MLVERSSYVGTGGRGITRTRNQPYTRIPIYRSMVMSGVTGLRTIAKGLAILLVTGILPRDSRQDAIHAVFDTASAESIQVFELVYRKISSVVGDRLQIRTRISTEMTYSDRFLLRWKVYMT